MMTIVINSFSLNKSYFGNPGSGGIVVYAVLQDSFILQDQVRLLAASVQKIIGVPTKPASYSVLGSREPRDVNIGIVVVEGFPSGPVEGAEHLSAVPFKNTKQSLYTRFQGSSNP